MTPEWSNRACHWNRQGRRKRDGLFHVPKLLLRHAIVFEAPLRRERRAVARPLAWGCRSELPRRARARSGRPELT